MGELVALAVGEVVTDLVGLVLGVCEMGGDVDAVLVVLDAAGRWLARDEQLVMLVDGVCFAYFCLISLI